MQSQVILMDSLSNGLVFTNCSGTFCGSEGPFSGGDYLTNQNYTITICPENPGDPISLDFVIFDLDISGADDQLIIYDGSNIFAPIIGTYINNQLLGAVLTASNANPDGCLTLSFVSNNSGVGSFLANISCGIPCERPIAVVADDAPNLRKICVDQLVNFDASNSIQNGGFTIDKYHWDFDDGIIDTISGPFVSHSYAQPGQYNVSIKLTNNDGCVNSNSIDLVLLVSTYPSFNPISIDSTICSGEVIDLIAVPNNYEVTYTNIPGLEIGPPNIFPDCPPESFETILNFQDFDMGQTLDNIADLESICINMEHSYSGDLSIEIVCPDGNNVILKEFGGGGGSMFLGEPTDLDGTANPDDCHDPLNNIAGIGYDYCWTPAMNNGTWADNSGIYFYNYIDLQGNSYTDATYLPAGNYESDNSLEGLLGCHLNGEWKLIVTDNLQADNGNLFGWSINFAPEIYPDIEEFTPQIGLDADSSFWSGLNIISASSSLDSISIQPFAVGIYPYIYTVINNHGCSFSDTVSITVELPPLVEIFADSTQICSDSVQLFTTINGVILPPNDNQNYFFEWTPNIGLSDHTAHSPMVLIDSTINYTVSVYKQYHPGCTTEDQIKVIGIPDAIATSSDTLFCGVNQFQLQALSVDTSLYNAYWENYTSSLNIANDLSFLADITASESGYFYLVWKVSNGYCIKTDTTHISLSLPIEINFLNQTPSCTGSCDGNSTATVDGGFQNTSAYGYNFLWNTGSTNSLIDSLCKGNYTLSVSDSLGCNAEAQFYIEEIFPLDFTYTVKNILCAGSCNGAIKIDCENAIEYSFDSGNTFTSDSILVGCAGSYNVVVRNIFGCAIDTSIQITEPMPLIAEFSMSPQPTNTNATRISFTNETTPNLVGNNYWIFNLNNPLGYSFNENPTFIFPDDTAGIYPVKLVFVDVNGCKDTIIHNVIIFDEVIAFIPNSFTPNGDGINDVFYANLLSQDLASFKMIVQSRKGEIVFKSNNPYDVWDGKSLSNQKESPSDVYVYEVIIRSFITDEDKVFNGSVTLIR
jgi:gliding motility-associated-like protein